jgi:hypothetical protein
MSAVFAFVLSHSLPAGAPAVRRKTKALIIPQFFLKVLK